MIVMNKEEIEEIETLEIDFKDTYELELALEVSSKKAIYLIDDLIKYLFELQQENKKYKEVIEKIKDIFDNGTFEDGCDCILIEKLLEDEEVE